MNVGSGAQVQQLLFAGVANSKATDKPGVPLERVFKASGGGGGTAWMMPWDGRVAVQGGERRAAPSRPAQVPNVDGLKGPDDKRAKKSWDITLHSAWGAGNKSPLEPEIFTPSGEAGVVGRAPARLHVGAVHPAAAAQRAHAETHVHPPAPLVLRPPAPRHARVQHPSAQVAGGQGGQGAPRSAGPGPGLCCGRRPLHAARAGRGRRGGGRAAWAGG